jgi:NAD(P)-dependent dehydrogenase (short-subunit alcohol dehydrogenase family)
MNQLLSDKVAVITGAGSEVGIGKDVALTMAKEGAKVVVNDIGKDADGNRGADRVVKEIKDAGGEAVANYDSVATMEGGRNIIKTALDNFGKIDILVNSAGNFIPKPTVEYEEKDWDAQINVHLKGMFACSHAAIKEMMKQQYGRIINITSAAGFIAKIKLGASIGYGTAKAGVLGFTKMLSLEMMPYGITVNAISPSAFTKLFPFEKKADGGLREGPDYVSPTILYLASDKAKDITGQIIYSSGGELRVFAPPMGSQGTKYAYKVGKWTVEELSEIIPKLVS